MTKTSKQMFPKKHALYPEGAVILEEEGKKKRILKLAEYEAEQKAKAPKAEKLKYDSNKK